MSKNRFLFPFMLLLLLSTGAMQQVHGQGQAKWLGVGSLNNFYMPIGIEREHALVSSQQYGLRWPALYDLQDMQAAKGFWIGTTNFTDEAGNDFPYKVIHAGPRVPGIGSFFPIEHKMVGRFPSVDVLVDDEETLNVADDVDEVDPNLPADRMVYTKLHSQIGITVERRVYQFSQEFHDNYHILEYTFTNTGRSTASDNVTLPNKTLTDVMFFWQYRYSVVRQTRYVIGNATGWGINAMVDRFGDGLGPDYGAHPDLRGHFVWHGKAPNFTLYDNIGGPIWFPSQSAGFVEPQDSLGRLGAYHFVGNALLHADTAPGNTAHNPAQPYTMTEVESDDALNSANDPFNNARMTREYNNFLRAGRTPRHAYIVEPTGDPGFLEPTGEVALGTSGGWSAATGIGPYTLGPGESIRIVLVEGASGISREQAVITGIQYRQGQISALEKNQVVFQGRDSLMQTFNRAKANFDSGFNIPEPPLPPSSFIVNSGGDGIYLEWTYPASEQARITGFEVYRAAFRRDSLYVKVAELPPSAREFADTDANPVGGPTRGLDYYYYIQAIGQPGDNDGSGLTPAGALRSNRYLTQTYDTTRCRHLVFRFHEASPLPSL